LTPAERLAVLAQRHGLASSAVAELQQLVDSAIEQERTASTLGPMGLGTGGDALSDPSAAEITLPVDASTDELEMLGQSQAHLRRYDDQGLLGRGGIGEVRRVYDRDLRREVAMKVLRDDTSPSALARFVEEAQLTAQLGHPAVVPIHDMGRLPDGRLYFTMRLVEGSTYRDVLRRWHRAVRAGAPVRWRTLTHAFLQVCEAMAFAHARGVVHRDLKPANIMVGDYGMVHVVDWGLALFLPYRGPRRSVGTPSYMPPEQARGDTGPDARSDVWALGATLVEVLTGSAPWPGMRMKEVMSRLKRRSPPVLPPQGHAPDALWSLARRCLQPDPADRPADAGELVGAVTDWLDGVAQRERALLLVDEASELGPRVARLRQRADDALDRAEALRAEVSPRAPIELKRPWWTLQDTGRELQQQARLAESEELRLLHAALSMSPNLPEAHHALARGYQRRLLAAEARGDDQAAAELEPMVRHHDHDGSLAEWLEGTGRLVLDADVPGATARLVPQRMVDRRYVDGPAEPLGPLPVDRPLARGSWVVEVSAPGHVTARVPVFVDRGRRWEQVVHLPASLPEGACYVPAGPFWSGGDPDVPCLPRRRLVVPGFAMQRFPVTNAEYIRFLDALVDDGREAEALRHAPHTRSGSADSSAGVQIFGRDADGHFVIQPDEHGHVWDPAAPIVMVDWPGAMAYAAWWSEVTGRAWRLPIEFEWEKAARGVDGRRYPWGDHPDATWMCIRSSHEGSPKPEVVDSFPLDVSPYGVRGLGGNVRDWCLDRGEADGPALDGDHVVVPDDPQSEEGAPAYRGGDWYGLPMHAVAAYRAWNRTDTRLYVLGFRLVTQMPAADAG
jgi:serine/threonine-protein kinase